MPTILVVDDEEDIRDLIALNLQREGFDTLEAADGLEAFKIAKKKEPDLVILDLMTVIRISAPRPAENQGVFAERFGGTQNPYGPIVFSTNSQNTCPVGK